MWWEGCPSHPQALAQLREVLGEEGLDSRRVDVREVPSDETAEREGFVGSPTIRIDGRDIAPTEGEPVGLTCRVYRARDGGVSPIPDREDLRDALRRHLQHGT
ncbi:MAG: DUF2703 domain-containing protein [Actinomycetota bacterium]|nr:DUF2703 domain-containing protein [Actinomycetota bacterium]